jgi:hypothetical protein
MIFKLVLEMLYLNNYIKRVNYQPKIYTLGLKLSYLDLFLLHNLIGHVSGTGDVLKNENKINLMKLNTLSSQTNEEITKELPKYPNLRTNNNQKILNFEEDKNYYCVF